MEGLILRASWLVVPHALYQIVTASRILLGHIQGILVATACILFLFTDYVLIVLQKLAGFILGS